MFAIVVAPEDKIIGLRSVVSCVNRASLAVELCVVVVANPPIFLIANLN